MHWHLIAERSDGSGMWWSLLSRERFSSEAEANGALAKRPGPTGMREVGFDTDSAALLRPYRQRFVREDTPSVEIRLATWCGATEERDCGPYAEEPREWALWRTG